MTTYPLPTLAATVTAAGISAPAFNDILLSLQASYTSIYGTDVDFDPDTQDGQWLGIQAKMVSDSNQTAIAVYNQFSPATAQGAGLSSVVKINGIARLSSSNSTAAITVVGQAGLIITEGLVGDNVGLNTEWALPTSVTIPIGGSITVTGICTTPGAIAATAGTLTKILTPTANWQSANNTSDAAMGDPVEIDAQLRQRQAVSTQLPAKTVLGAIVGNIANLTGVTDYQAYENDTDIADGNSLPPHSICLSILGGDLQSIVDIIGSGKAPGADTYGGGTGATSGTYVDPIAGIPYTINYNIPSQESINGTITIVPTTGYNTAIGDEIIAAVVAYINSLNIGADVQNTRLVVPAYLVGPYASPSTPTDGATYEVTSIVTAIGGGSQTSADIAIAFNQIAKTIASNWVLNT